MLSSLERRLGPGGVAGWTPAKRFRPPAIIEPRGRARIPVPCQLALALSGARSVVAREIKPSKLRSE
jgi:hypothetical protein